MRSRTPESEEFRLQNYRNAIKFQWWLASNNIPIEWTNQLNRKELFVLKDIIEEDMKSKEA